METEEGAVGGTERDQAPSTPSVPGENPPRKLAELAPI